jgi:hypothetical protein
VLQRSAPAPSRDDLQREFDGEKVRAKLLSGGGDKDGARQFLERAKALAARIQALAGTTVRSLRPLPRPLPWHLGLPLLSLRRALRHADCSTRPRYCMGMALAFDPALLEAPLPDFDDVDVDDDDVDPEDEAALLPLTGDVPTQPTGTPEAPCTWRSVPRLVYPLLLHLYSSHAGLCPWQRCCPSPRLFRWQRRRTWHV